MIEWSPKILQVAVASTLLCVWLLRFGRPTSFRGGKAKNLKEEFSVYGLPKWSFWAVGSSKVSLSFALLAGIYFDELVKPAALVLAVFMLAAVWMHLKIKRDSLVKALPAYMMLSACVFLIFN